MKRVLRQKWTIETNHYSFLFDFSQWGDAFFMTLQVTLIVVQILYYTNRLGLAMAFALVTAALSTAIYHHMVSLYILTSLQAATIPITVIAKVLYLCL